MSKALREAIEANDAVATEKAAKTVKDLGRKLPKSNTPVGLACELGAEKALAALLEAGAPVAAPDTFKGFHPFAVAEEKGHVNVMRVLAEKSEIPPEVAEHALQLATMGGRADSVAFILETFKPKVGLFLLEVANWWKGGRILKIYLDHGIDVNMRNDGKGYWEDRDGTVLHRAASGGHAEAIRLLIAAGADVNARDIMGRTPLLILAARLPELICEQREAGGLRRPLGDRDPENGTESLKALLELGADPKAFDRFGNGAIMYYLQGAMHEREKIDAECMNILKKAGAKDDAVLWSLFESIRNSNPKAATAAIKAGADVNHHTPPPQGGTPLIWARSAEIVNLLIKAGADVNEPSIKSTPLISAARSGELEIVKLLVKAGVDIHAIEPRSPGSEHLANAYSAADTNRKFEVVDYLKSLGAGMPVLKDWKPVEAGVGMWENFSEILVEGPVGAVADALAAMIKGKVMANVYGQSFAPGTAAYVVVRPKGMKWSNVFRIAPRPELFEDEKAIKTFATDLSARAKAPVLSIQYGDAAGAAEVKRFDARGATTLDDGWDRATLQEVVGEWPGEAPAALKKKLAAIEEKEDHSDSSERLKALAEKERFAVASFFIQAQPGRDLEIVFLGLPAEAFDGVAFVTN